MIFCPFCFEEFLLKDAIKGGRVKCTCCSKSLPNNAVDYRKGLSSTRISIIGARHAGKSHFIAVLIHCIRESHGEFGWTLRPMDDATMERYEKRFYNPVFVDGITIPQTNRSTTDAQTSEPLSYILTLKSGGKRKTVYLSFYDTAGESLNAEDTISRESKYVYNSDAIIVLLDPLQLSSVRKELEGKVSLEPQTTHPAEILSRTSNLIRRAKQIPQDKPLKIPIGVAFSKIDVVLPLFPAGSSLRYESKHLGHFNHSEFQAVDSEMRMMLNQWGTKGLIGQVETDFPKNGFFGFSALGSNPGPDQRIPKVEPFRVLDAFLWQLNNLNLIDSEE